jgi:hypothetical protein
MAKNYDADFYELDASGNRVGDKDWGAWNAAQAGPTNTPAGPPPDPNAGSTVAPTPTAAAPTADWQGLSDQTFGTVKKDMGFSTVNQQDPAYQQQVQSNQLQTDRAADRARAAMAQRRQATGTGTSGAVNTDVNKVLEQQAYQDKAFEGQLLDKFRQQGLDEKARALQIGSGMLTGEQERALRGALTREGYDVQRDTAADDLNFRRDALGQQLALSQAQMDQDAMLALLGGSR